jgi:hypothetical protein
VSIKSRLRAAEKCLRLDRPALPPPPAIHVQFIEAGTMAVVDEFTTYPPGAERRPDDPPDYATWLAKQDTINPNQF